MAIAAKQKKVKPVSRGKLPTKRTINLATVGEKPIRWYAALPSILLILALAALLSKFAVVDRYMALSRAQQQANSVAGQVADAHAIMDSYGELVDEYAHYTYSGMTPEELGLVDRVEVMRLLERVVLPQATVNSWTLHNNQLSLPMTGSSLEQINMIVQQLQAEPLVDFCTVSTAATNQVTMRDDVVTGGDVTAQVTVYLVSAQEAGEGSQP